MERTHGERDEIKRQNTQEKKGGEILKSFLPGEKSLQKWGIWGGQQPESCDSDAKKRQ